MAVMRTVLFALSLASMLGSCSSVSDFPTINSFTATPGSLPAGGGAVTLAWNVSGATTLSVDQTVGAVTPTGTGSASALVTAFTTFTLTAANSVGTTTSEALVTVAGPVTVHGTVVDQTSGLPLAGVTAIVTSGAFNQAAVTGADGTFTLAQVPTPYNVTLLDGTARYALEFVGLTRGDPVLPDVVGSPSASRRAATLTGEVTGGSYPESPSHATTWALFASPQTMNFFGEGCVTSSFTGPCSVINSAGSHSAQIGWLGLTGTTGALYVLQTVLDEAMLPVGYAYGQLADISLEDGATLSNQDLRLEGISTGALEGTVNVPLGMNFNGTRFSLLLSSTIPFPLTFDGSVSTTFRYVVPSLQNTSLLVAATGTVVGAPVVSATVQKRVSENGSPVTLSLPPPPTQVEPASGATGVSVTTPFAWTPFAQGVHIFQLSFDDEAFSQLALIVYTAASTASLPDLADAGLVLRPSTEYLWDVDGLAPVASIDALTAPGAIQSLKLRDYLESGSGPQQFTTGP